MAKATVKDTVTAKYLVLRRVDHDDDSYGLGDEIELNKADAAALLAIGAIRVKDGAKTEAAAS